MLNDRLKMAIPLVAAALLAFCWPGLPGAVAFGLLVVFFGVLGAREFFALTAAAGQGGYPRLTGGFGCLFLVLAALGGGGAQDGGSILALVAFVFACFALALRGGPPTAARLLPVWVSIGGFVYVFWCLAFLVRLYFLVPGDSAGRWLLLYLVVVTKAADTGGYVVGTLTARRPGGNRKLVPSISPKKSWEGLYGATAASVLCAVGLAPLLSQRTTVGGTALLTLGGALLIGLLSPVVGLLGDLAESALKRAAGAKDSGRLPGLGGALDILDSLVPMGPLFYAYLLLRLTP